MQVNPGTSAHKRGSIKSGDILIQVSTPFDRMNAAFCFSVFERRRKKTVASS
jgi:hypothetical protein